MKLKFFDTTTNNGKRITGIRGYHIVRFLQLNIPYGYNEHHSYSTSNACVGFYIR